MLPAVPCVRVLKECEHAFAQAQTERISRYTLAFGEGETFGEYGMDSIVCGRLECMCVYSVGCTFSI